MASLVALCLKTSAIGELMTSHHSFTEDCLSALSVPGAIEGADHTALNRTLVIPDKVKLKVCSNDSLQNDTGDFGV